MQGPRYLDHRIARPSDLLDDRLAPLLRVDDVASILRVDPRTVRRLAAAGTLETIRIGSSVRFSPDAVTALVDAGRKGGA